MEKSLPQRKEPRKGSRHPKSEERKEGGNRWQDRLVLDNREDGKVSCTELKGFSQGRHN